MSESDEQKDFECLANTCCCAVHSAALYQRIGERVKKVISDQDDWMAAIARIDRKHCLELTALKASREKDIREATADGIEWCHKKYLTERLKEIKRLREGR